MRVDFELRGCPINKHQLLEVISAFLNERKPAIAEHSVCIECKRRGTVCVMVAHGTPVPRSRHARRLRRDLPGLQPRLLRLLRADGDAEHGQSSAPGGSGSARPTTSCLRVYRAFNAEAEPFRRERRGA